MESIIIAMLYLYPGALVDVIRQYFFRRSFKNEDTNENGRVAKYFVYSTFISVLSLFVYAMLCGKSVANPEDILRSLSGTFEIPKYFLISLAVTTLSVLVIHGANQGLIWVKSFLLKKTDSLVVSPSIDAWHEIQYCKEFEGIRGYFVLKIIAGENVTAGFSLYLPEFYKDGILLMHQDLVREAFEKDRNKDADDPDRLIYGPVAAYFDAETATTVEFYNGYNLSKTLE